VKKVIITIKHEEFMELKKWMNFKNMNASTFARIIGMSRGQVQKWITKGAIPKPEIMIKIFKTTKEAVTPNDFYGLVLTDPNDEKLSISRGQEVVNSNQTKAPIRLYEDYKIKK